mgnify:CR=1 FL=1
MSWAEILVCLAPLEEMQTLSDIASAAPKAQQEPQLAWSLISPIDEQFGQLVLESKEAGAESLRGWETSGSSGPPTRAPIKAFTFDFSISWNLDGASAFQLRFWELMLSAMFLSLAL